MPSINALLYSTPASYDKCALTPTHDRPPCHVSAQVVIPVGLDFGYCQADDVSERVIFVRNTGEVSIHYFPVAVTVNH